MPGTGPATARDGNPGAGTDHPLIPPSKLQGKPRLRRRPLLILRPWGPNPGPGRFLERERRGQGESPGRILALLLPRRSGRCRCQGDAGAGPLFSLLSSAPVPLRTVPGPAGASCGGGGIWLRAGGWSRTEPGERPPGPAGLLPGPGMAQGGHRDRLRGHWDRQWAQGDTETSPGDTGTGTRPRGTPQPRRHQEGSLGVCP